MVSLTSGVLFLCLAVLGFVLTLLGSRNPRSPAWANDFLIANVYAPGILTLVVFGVAILFQAGFAAPRDAFGLAGVWPAAAIIAVTAAIIKALHPRRTLAAYASRSAPVGQAGGDEAPQPPQKPSRPRMAA